MSKTGRVVAYILVAAVLVVGTVVVMRVLQPPPVPPAAVTPDSQTPGGVGQAGVATATTATAPTGTAPAATGSVVLVGTVILTGTVRGAGDAAADDGLALAAGGQLCKAQLRLSEALAAGVYGAKGKSVRDTLASLADKIQFSNQCLPDDPYSKSYAIVSGDSLIGIGGKYLVPHELIMKMNHLATPSIAAGQSLKVLQGPIHLEISKGHFEVQAWLDKVCVRAYPIAIGADDTTPEGTFVVKSKMRNPPYQPQHKAKSAFKEAGAPDNPLGTRWIDIGNHYGLHGTIDPTSIGHAASEGCIRLSNKDVEELFDMVVPGASKVTIKA